MIGRQRGYVLLVAPDADLVRLLEKAVERAGVAPRGLHAPLAGLPLTETDRPLGVVVDLGAGGHSQLLRILRRRKIPVLALVTDTDSLFRGRAGEASLDGCQYLAKPFSALAVTAWVKHVAANPVGRLEVSGGVSRPRLAAAFAVAGLALVIATVSLGLLLPGRQDVLAVPEAAPPEPAPIAPTPYRERAPAPVATAAPTADAPRPVATAIRVESTAQTPVVTFVPRVSPPVPTASSDLVPDPVERVRLFYQYLQGGDFENMGWLLSERFKSSMPWDPKVLRERTPPGQINIEEIQVVEVDPPQLTATVAVRVVEQAGPPLPSLHTYAGTWRLVRGPAGWLMDQPQLEEQ